MRASLQWVLATLLLFGAGCARPEPAQPAAGVAAPALRPIVLQTDWLPQAEHGGFYQALARGFYAEAGLAVELLPGGVNAQVNLRVARGDADFGLNRSDLLQFVTRALTHKERFIIEQYYQVGHTMREIGEMLALTESRVCQIHSNVMSRLKGLLGPGATTLLP